MALGGSTLAACLTKWDLLASPPGDASPIDGLGRWIGWTDALALSTALQASPGATAAAAPRVDATGAEREFTRVRDALSRAIDDERELDDDFEFAPYRRHVAALQRQMETRIGPLRSNLRAAVARRSSSLARLAALDAALADAMAPQEQRLLGLMPSLLEKHFHRLRRAAVDDTWRARFRQDMRQLLRAELELRLQPAQGLLDTLRPAPGSP